MSSRGFLIIAAGGVLLAIVVAFLLNRPHNPQPPAFQPAANPYAKAIYAEGIIEGAQSSGENINVLPEVSGPVIATFVKEGDVVHAGQPLFAIDDSVQRGTTEQERLQAQAAMAALSELKAEPRRETLAVAIAQLAQAQANLKSLVDVRDKVERSAQLDPRSISHESLDSAIDAARAGEEAVAVAQRQLELTKAGAWIYDIQNQQAQYQALTHAYQAGAALLSKYVVKAPTDGVVLALNVANGDYVSPQGAYDTYTEANAPAAVLSPGSGVLAVRCYIDEILLSRLPKGADIKAEMIIRGSNVHVPLQFVRIQPYVTPKIELSDERQERVDLRVLPVIFNFHTDPGLKLYPGQLVDVYVNEQ
ncbi:MAG TPA: biotin/lipoyl-binding protein [Caulobacteraceae bacterium]|nr:biotin/lipoyl-binding protein [Caulobacteraceae bacterium]